jgi:hypothetical protein
LIAATAGERSRRRVLVINPEPDASHIQPILLADEQHLPPLDPRDLAERIHAHVRTLRGTLGAILPLQPPAQFGEG